MSDIVWAIDPKHDRLLDLAARMRRFAADMLATRRIAFQFRSPDEWHDVPIDTDQRRQMFLVFKEAMHNAVRHSRCTEVQIDFGLEAQHLVLRVGDNGTGFDAGGATEGHGLASMHARTRAIGGALHVTSAAGSRDDRSVRDAVGQHDRTPKGSIVQRPDDPVSPDGVGPSDLSICRLESARACPFSRLPSSRINRRFARAWLR